MNSEILSGRVAIVTGAGQGMGREHALLLSRLGASIVVNGVDEFNATKVADEIRSEGGSAAACRADVSDPSGAAEVIETAITSFGGLHIVVSNAAIINSISFAEMDHAEFDRVMKVNAYGAFNVVKEAWPHLMRQRFGRIVMVSSSSAWIPQSQIGHYAASKGAVLGLSQTLAAEGSEHGITVNVLAPGAFTGMLGAQADRETVHRVKTTMPARLVAPAVAWLVRDENTRTGEIFEVAAGRVARNFVGSTKGYWNRELSLEDLQEHARDVDELDGHAVLTNTIDLVQWMTKNTGWELPPLTPAE
ncbi:SDR family NAD(P)-dependent oxidoreductase [Nocardia vinacea]|uniref:SDR family NAD(P)-dependent oxidoreductase n=1 Tax=Nocardia vinacea TaxID=96468 RepID=UPI0006845ADC|nr:SDR family NAD(P)-dependent oxidoreductase [Nocardia vinacea]